MAEQTPVQDIENRHQADSVTGQRDERAVRYLLSTATFQAIVSTLLALGVITWLVWLLRASGPYGWLRGRLMVLGAGTSEVAAGFLAFLIVFVIWMVPTVLLRRLTPLGPVRRQLSPSQLRNLPRDVQTELAERRRRESQMLGLPPHAPERRRFYRRMGWTGVAVGLVTALVTWIVWRVTNRLWLWGAVFSAVSLAAGLASGISGRPVAFHRHNLGRVQRTTRLVVAVVAVLALIVIGAVCALQTFRVT